MAQSLGREFGLSGIYVAHAIIDGVIDLTTSASYLADAGPEAKISSGTVRSFPSPTIRIAEN